MITNNIDNYGLNHLIWSKQVHILMPQNPELLAKTFETLKVDGIIPFMHGDLDGAFKVDNSGLTAYLDQIKVIKDRKVYTGGEYISLIRNKQDIENKIDYYEKVKNSIPKDVQQEKRAKSRKS